ncbi:MAG: maleylpyruvate isomerase family mycothiol-dependent enzyme [Nocardioides sp.]|nr:maleylpyruvate isomerase family mycothiol-dependent enzyme [Nocardioides sp.]
MAPTPEDYLAAVRRETARFRAVLAEADLEVAVPTCPGWTAADLLHHLAEVQWFWSRVLSENVTEDPDLDEPVRAEDRAGLLAFLDRAHDALTDQLASLDPGEHRWSWAEEQTVGFTLRRQAHEALVHRLDAELAVGAARAEVDPDLAADGVDEALRVMFGGVPRWATFTPGDGAVLRIAATDTGDAWTIVLGRFAGIAPSGTTYDEPMLDVLDGSDAPTPGATVSAAAADLDAWLWNRPTLGPVDRDGDDDALRALQEILDAGID